MTTATVDVGTHGLRWVDQVMDACNQLIQPVDRWHWCEYVAKCFYNSVDEVAKANLAVRQSTLALSPMTTSSGRRFSPSRLEEWEVLRPRNQEVILRFMM
jgi:hypothetical protein